MSDWQEITLYTEDGRSITAKARVDGDKITIQMPPEAQDVPVSLLPRTGYTPRIRNTYRMPDPTDP